MKITFLPQRYAHKTGKNFSTSKQKKTEKIRHKETQV